MDVAQRDRLYLAREEAAEGIQIARSQGSFLFDQHGKKYLDFTAGRCVGNLGWGNEEIRAAVRDFGQPTQLYARKYVEARGRIELPYKGFADLLRAPLSSLLSDYIDPYPSFPGQDRAKSQRTRNRNGGEL